MNITKFVPGKVTQIAARQVLKTQKASPKLLFAAGVVGVVATGVLAARGTLKIDHILEETQVELEKTEQGLAMESDDYTHRDYLRDRSLIYIRFGLGLGKVYGPAIATGIFSICALTGSHVILTRRNVALTAAYKAVEQGFEEYRSRVTSEFGYEKEQELRHGYVSKKIVEDTKEGPVVREVKGFTLGTSEVSIYARFFDQTCDSWDPKPEFNMIFLKAQQQYANNLLHARGHLFLNEVYDALGIDRSQAGQVVGWTLSKDGDGYVDFGLFDGSRESVREFVNGNEHSILLDFNVEGLIYDKI